MALTLSPPGSSLCNRRHRENKRTPKPPGIKTAVLHFAKRNFTSSAPATTYTMPSYRLKECPRRVNKTTTRGESVCNLKPCPRQKYHTSQKKTNRALVVLPFCRRVKRVQPDLGEKKQNEKHKYIWHVAGRVGPPRSPALVSDFYLHCSFICLSSAQSPPVSPHVRRHFYASHLVLSNAVAQKKVWAIF